tara:strand:+ start:1988 stop:2518 length:531 start_codon:yes stop_codon:yes gene_type:complete
MSGNKQYIPPFQRPIRFTPRRLNRVIEAVPSIEAGAGLAVERRGSRISLTKPSITEPPGRATFWGRILASEGDAANRWTYQYEEVVLPGEGYVGWETRLGPTARAGTAYNFAEIPNKDDGIQGNGVNVDTLPQGFFVQPIAVGVIVALANVRRAGGQGFEQWFLAMNAVDGICPGG